MIYISTLISLSLYKPGARYPGGWPLPELDDNADVADDDGDEGEDELGDVSEASVDEFVCLFPGFLTDHGVGGGIFKQLHDQSIAVNILSYSLRCCVLLN